MPACLVAVVNCGSSSVKLDVIRFPEEETVLSLQVERVGKPGTSLTLQRVGEEKQRRSVEGRDIATAAGLAFDEVAAAGLVPEVVGHRVVHGGARFTESVLIDVNVLEQIRSCVPLAPLHNPANLVGMETAQRRLPHAPHVAVFDTAFHQTLAAEAYLYAIPRALHEEQGVRRYGFHGTSHRYVAERAAAFLKRPPSELCLVTLHLGNGCSACAVQGGKSVDTSMGMTPLEGLVMGTRCGDLDPAVVLRLAREGGVDAAEKILNQESGLLGLSKKSHDMRDLEEAARGGDVDADLAIRVFARRTKKTLGAYAAVLGQLDAVVFTGGIGENSARVRREICRGLDLLGVNLDDHLNEARSTGERDIAARPSRARVLVIPTDEELAIARDAVRLVPAGASG